LNTGGLPHAFSPPPIYRFEDMALKQVNALKQKITRYFGACKVKEIPEELFRETSALPDKEALTN
jgi:hypothetical protein